MIGKTILHYKILSKLGEGGMGVVYKAEDTKLMREVAIKFLPRPIAASDEERERFKIEAQAAAALNHANIATVYSIEEAGDETFIVMEYIKGLELKDKIDAGPLSIDLSLEIAIQIAQGLQIAHEAGVVHRDIKSSNIMLTDRDEVKIMDFGLAKRSGHTRLTKEGTTLGTAAYMSPEQARGNEVDRRSDIFSFGVLLYEMLTGQLPFKGDYEQAVTYSILNEDPEPVTGMRTGISLELERIVDKALRKAPSERYQHLDEMLVDLKSVDRTLATRKDPQLSAKTRKMPLFGLLALVILAAVIGFFYWWQRSGDNASPTPGSMQRLAVLPFGNIREDPETDFLGFALADQIIGSMAYLKNISVRPSSSIRKYQNQALDAKTVGEELQVDIVLTGNYLREANMIRLNVELIEVEADEMIWREPIEVEYENAFKLQDIVSAKIIDGLKLQFSRDERARMQSNISHNPLAYEYYLRSLSYPQDVEGNRLAVNMLHQSIELDSTFAPAWAALGRRTYLIAYWELGGEKVLNQAKGFHLKALEINPGLFNALAHLTMIYTDQGETHLAMKTARRMLEINPNSGEAIFAYGYVLHYAGMLEESMTAMDSALEIDPTNPLFRSAAWTYIHNDRYDDALETYKLGEPNLLWAWQGEVAIRRGQLKEASVKLSKAIAYDPDGITGLWATGLLSALQEDYGRGIEAADKWEEANLSDGQGWYYLAGLYLLNGEIDKGISVLDTAVERGYFSYPHFLKCRFLDPARGKPGFDAVLEKARLKHEAFKKEFFK